ncbi:helix-turn-helix domain-containing protein [Bacillus sp. NPDC077027]|uniref:helix-turn-helix domain-containing protein n=1 Tax=Bacillus sp. NPDC077027 TaxID=3390548 RepID=UPI003D04688E
MLEKLKLVYGQHIITKPSSDENILWYQTDQGEVFGVDPSQLTHRETLLLNSFLKPIDPFNTLATDCEKSWYSYLFEDKSLPIIDSVQVHYFKMEHQPEQRQQIKEAVNGVFEGTQIVWTGAESAMMIQTNVSSDYGQQDILLELSHAFTSDFLTDSIFFQGQLHVPNDHLRTRLLKENQLFLRLIERGKLRSGVSSFYLSLPYLACYDSHELTEAISDAFREAISDRDIVNTLSTYMRCNLNASQAAKALYVHRNSLQYRIDKFIERTGIDIRHFSEASAAYFMMNLLNV